MPLEKCANKPTEAETTERTRIRTRKPRHHFTCLILGLPSFPCITNIFLFILRYIFTATLHCSFILLVAPGGELWLVDTTRLIVLCWTRTCCSVLYYCNGYPGSAFSSWGGGLSFIGSAFSGTSGISMYCLGRTEFKMATAAFQKLRCGAGSIHTYSCSVS